jgi:excisionase family DNA binding protein
MSNKEWITTQDIAEKLDIHVETVRRWLRTGSLRGIHVGGKDGYPAGLRATKNTAPAGPWRPSGFLYPCSKA